VSYNFMDSTDCSSAGTWRVARHQERSAQSA
jgi:hypothetical protein